MLWHPAKWLRRKSSEDPRHGNVTRGTQGHNRERHIFIGVETGERDTLSLTGLRRSVERLVGHDAAVLMELVGKVYTVTRGYAASVEHHDSQEGGLWSHSFAVAAACSEAIGRYSQERGDRLAAFVAGLLHDIGKIGYWIVDAHGYDFSPWLLQPLPTGAQVTGKRNEGGWHRHQMLSVVFMGQLLDNPLKVALGPDRLQAIAEAIALSPSLYTSIQTENSILLALRDADRSEVAAAVEQMTAPVSPVSPPSLVKPAAKVSTQKPVTAPVTPAKAESDALVVTDTTAWLLGKPQPPKGVDIEIWKNALRHKVQHEWQEGFHFYVFKEAKVLAVVYPLQTKDLKALFEKRAGQTYAESILLQAIERADLLAMRHKDGKGHMAALTITRHTREDAKRLGVKEAAHLTCLCLRLEDLFSPEEIAAFKGAEATKAEGIRVPRVGTVAAETPAIPREHQGKKVEPGGGVGQEELPGPAEPGKS
jgi:hypothetical protein